MQGSAKLRFKKQGLHNEKKKRVSMYYLGKNEKNSIQRTRICKLAGKCQKNIIKAFSVKYISS